MYIYIHTHTYTIITPCFTLVTLASVIENVKVDHQLIPVFFDDPLQR